MTFFNIKFNCLFTLLLVGKINEPICFENASNFKLQSEVLYDNFVKFFLGENCHIKSHASILIVINEEITHLLFLRPGGAQKRNF